VWSVSAKQEIGDSMPDKKELKIQVKGEKISFETSEGWNVRMIVRVLSKLLCELLHSEEFRCEWEQEETKK